MIIPIPEVRKECSVCYQLLRTIEWNFKSNVDPYYTIGSDVPQFIQRHPSTYTIRSFCFNCNHVIDREYRDWDGQFRLISEIHTQEYNNGWNHLTTAHFGNELL